MGLVKEIETERQVGKLLQQGLIKPGKGGWSFPVVLVKKKYCVDYCWLNRGQTTA